MLTHTGSHVMELDHTIFSVSGFYDNGYYGQHYDPAAFVRAGHFNGQSHNTIDTIAPSFSKWRKILDLRCVTPPRTWGAFLEFLDPE